MLVAVSTGVEVGVGWERGVASGDGDGNGVCVMVGMAAEVDVGVGWVVDVASGEGVSAGLGVVGLTTGEGVISMERVGVGVGPHAATANMRIPDRHMQTISFPILASLP